MSNYKQTIGLEVHCELKTNNKMFSNSLSNYGDMANTNVNVVDLGYPGTLPVLNLDVVKFAIKACKVLNLHITKEMHFDRKNYFYPDNPKNFQITQQRTPIGTEGYIEIEVNGEKKKVEILEMHIEEDTCKSVHGKESSLLDFNRAGTPLIEIVTKPCMNSGDEAFAYLTKLKELLLYSDVSDCKIEEGSMRCDVNISISDTDKLGTKVEVKNIGSISNCREAINYEAKRQEDVLKNFGNIVEETRRFDDKTMSTVSLRVKETGNDYRYFPEPDLPYITLTDEFINNAINELPTLPDERRNKYKEAGIQDINIEKIIANKDLSDYLEQFNNINLVIASNLLLGEISAYLNKTNTTINNTKLTNERFIELVNKLDSKEISNKIFKEILDDIMESDQSIDQIIESKGLKLVSNEQDIINMINKVLDNNQELLNQYINGNDKASKALMGQVMKESHGSVDPSLANQLLNKILQSKRV